MAIDWCPPKGFYSYGLTDVGYTFWRFFMSLLRLEHFIKVKPKDGTVVDL